MDVSRAKKVPLLLVTLQRLHFWLSVIVDRSPLRQDNPKHVRSLISGSTLDKDRIISESYTSPHPYVGIKSPGHVHHMVGVVLLVPFKTNGEIT